MPIMPRPEGKSTKIAEKILKKKLKTDSDSNVKVDTNFIKMNQLNIRR